MVFPPISTSSLAVLRMYASGVCHRIISATAVGIKAGLALSFQLVWELVECVKPATHGVSGCIVAANDEENEIA